MNNAFWGVTPHFLVEINQLFWHIYPLTQKTEATESSKQVEIFYQITWLDITNNSVFYGRHFLKKNTLINGSETFTHKIAELLLEKLQFSSQMRHDHNSVNFVK